MYIFRWEKLMNMSYKFCILFSILFFNGKVFAKNLTVNDNLELLLKRVRPNAKYYFMKEGKDYKSSKYDRLRMKNKPSFHELGNELNIYQEIQARKKGY